MSASRSTIRAFAGGWRASGLRWRTTACVHHDAAYTLLPQPYAARLPDSSLRAACGFVRIGCLGPLLIALHSRVGIYGCKPCGLPRKPRRRSCAPTLPRTPRTRPSAPGCDRPRSSRRRRRALAAARGRPARGWLRRPRASLLLAPMTRCSRRPPAKEALMQPLRRRRSQRAQEGPLRPSRASCPARMCQAAVVHDGNQVPVVADWRSVSCTCGRRGVADETERRSLGSDPVNKSRAQVSSIARETATHKLTA